LRFWALNSDLSQYLQVNELVGLFIDCGCVVTSVPSVMSDI
jgi:hypothetical protein